jgi:uncharacterized protein
MVTPAQIDEIVQIFVQKCQPEKIILFGSYAHGTANEDSDLDIAVVKESDLPRRKRSAEFSKALFDAGFRRPFAMDILVYTPEEMAFYRNDRYSLVLEISLTGKTLYESNKSARLVSQS